jgi:hypothetical protein
VCSLVDVLHASASPVAAMFMVKFKPIMKLKTAAQTESQHGKTYS